MSLTAQQLADLMPDATEVESHEPKMEILTLCPACPFGFLFGVAVTRML
jgi:hypothetical protein